MQTLRPTETQIRTAQSAIPRQALLKSLTEATRKLVRRLDVQDELDDARTLLESLLMSTEEFSLACKRLWNAGRFVRAGESGAANWEIQTLHRWVLRHGNSAIPGLYRIRWISQATSVTITDPLSTSCWKVPTPRGLHDE